MGELLTSNKIFDRDWMVYRYYISESELKLALLGSVPGMLERYVNQLLMELLQRDYSKRPRVITLRPLFNLYFLLIRHSISETFDLLSLLVEYHQWKELVCKALTQQELVVQLFHHFKSTLNYQPAIAFVLQLIREEPQKCEYWEELEDAYKKNVDNSYAVSGWRSIVEFYLTFAAAHFYLTAACLMTRSHSLACKHWRQLHETYLTN